MEKYYNPRATEGESIYLKKTQFNHATFICLFQIWTISVAVIFRVSLELKILYGIGLRFYG